MNVHFVKNRIGIIFLLFSLLLFFITISNDITLISLEHETYLIFHLLLQIINIIISSAIFLYGWLTWNYSKSKILLLISVIFLAVAIIDIFHTFTYDGMPFHLGFNIQVPNWFWIIGKIFEICAFLTVFLLNKWKLSKSTSKYENIWFLALSLLLTFLCSILILHNPEKLPLLVIEGVGTTPLKKVFEYAFILFYVLTVPYLWKRYQKHKNEFHISLIFSFIFLTFSSLTVTFYHSSYDQMQIIGHVFKVLGYFYILKAFYFTNIKGQYYKKKLTEKQLLQTRHELKNILLHHQGIMIKVVKVGNDFIFQLCDGKLLSKLKLKSDKIVGYTPFHFLNYDLALKLHNEFEKVWNGEENGLLEFEVAEGVFLLMTTTRVISDDGKVGIIGNIVDISETKHTEELLRRTEKLSIVGELAAGFAHEIRNPLTTIKGFLQLINQSADDKIKEYTSIMLKEIDRLEMITNEFMIVAKPQATKYHNINIIKTVDDVIQFLTPQTLLNNVQIFKNYIPEPVYIYGDEHQIKQVLINIYKNAMEAMENGGNILTELSKDEKYIYIKITDEGCGIPEDILPRLGEPFYTLKEKGTGLGLMVSTKIIQAHHGKIEITSTVNVGTTVSICFPIVEPLKTS